jgi:hypothetical protein
MVFTPELIIGEDKATVRGYLWADYANSASSLVTRVFAMLLALGDLRQAEEPGL